MTEYKEVEPKKEKLYTVEFSPPKNFGNNDFLHSNFLYLGDNVLRYILRKNEVGKVYLDWVAPKDWYTIPLKIAKLTEDEIKEEYEWAWSFAKEATD